MRALEERGLLRRPVIPDYADHNAHMYYVLVPDAETRSRLLQGLKREGIGGLFHYVPLHSAPAGRRFGRAHGALLNTDELSSRLVRLPLFYAMDDSAVERVCSIVESLLSSGVAV
jgi:dTDP-4-amino-4,6-dideoxygalactose transaminase